MAYYRLYYMNVRSGHIDSVATIDAPNDEDVIRLAGAQEEGGEPRELWCEGRKVCRFEARPSTWPMPTAAD